jgi:NADPH-dependent curcumin reductase CurA
MNGSAQKGCKLVTFREVALQIRNRRIFERVDWSIRGGERWAIIGPNGSGKSVLARALYGGVAVVGGEIEYHFPGRGETGPEVTAVDSAEKLDMLRSIGADHVIDYTHEDFTQNGQTYDVIFDIVGKASFSRSLRSLKKEGFLLLANLELSRMIRGLWISKTTAKKVVFGLAGDSADDLHLLKELIEAGKIKSVIDKRYPLEQIPEAHSYVDKGHKKGNVVITLGRDNKA